MIPNQMSKNVKLFYAWKHRNPKPNPYDWMLDDLYRGIQTDSFYLVALGLLSYSEAIGWVILNEKNNDSWDCYKVFTHNYIGYSNIKRKDWNDLRNGLAHRYYGKNRTTTINNDNFHSGIQSTKSTLSLHVGKYFQDFVKGLVKLLDEQSGLSNSIDKNNKLNEFNSGNRGFTGPPGPPTNLLLPD